jgi:Domain of unknown function (DUF4412)
MRRVAFSAVSAALLGALSASVACSKPTSLTSFEGTITMQTTLAGSSAQQMVVQTKGDKLRFDTICAGGPTHAVYDPASSKVQFFIDPDKKYVDLDFSLPSAAPNTDPGSSAIVRSGAHKKVAGYDCEQVSVTDAAGKRSDVCIAQGIAYFDVNGLRPGVQRAESAMAREFRLHKSFPLESVEFGPDGKEVSRMLVTKIVSEKLEDELFSVPSDYTKIDLPPRR